MNEFEEIIRDDDKTTAETPVRTDVAGILLPFALRKIKVKRRLRYVF